MEIKMPETLEKAWELIQKLAKELEELKKENEQLKKNQKKSDPPDFVKENVKKKKRKKKKGPKFGHEYSGFKRKKKIHERKRWFLKRCPHCDDNVSRAQEKVRRQEIDIPPVDPIVREHTIGRHWCNTCQKLVSATVPGLLPKTPYSQNVHMMASYMKYGLGMTLDKIRSLFKEIYGLEFSSGCLSEMLNRLKNKMEPAYDHLKEAAKEQFVLNADETGWRVDGINHWLWSFSSSAMVCYHIDPSRGQKVVTTFLGESFAGVLVSDFYNAYAAIKSIKQKCLVHVLRDIKKVIDEKDTKDVDAYLFAKKIKRQIKAAFKLKQKQEEMEKEDFDKRAKRIKSATINALELKSKSKFVRRMSKRLWKHRKELFVFLDNQAVPGHNNDAERQIRPTVLMRKTSYQNASPNGAKTQVVHMSIIQTCRKLGINYLNWGRKYLGSRSPPGDLFLAPA